MAGTLQTDRRVEAPCMKSSDAGLSDRSSNWDLNLVVLDMSSSPLLEPLEERRETERRQICKKHAVSYNIPNHERVR